MLDLSDPVARGSSSSNQLRLCYPGNKLLVKVVCRVRDTVDWEVSAGICELG